MSSIQKKLILLLFLSMIAGSFSYAQKLTGSIKGVVEENEGYPLPGVSVKASSPSLIGSQFFISTSDGIFRFPSLPPGIYEIAAELEGFQIVKRANVIVYVGKTTDIKMVMKPSIIMEEVIVTAPSPMVDKESSKIAHSYTLDLIENIPINRNISDIISLAPGIVSGTSHGGSVRANTYAIDGVNMNDPVTNTLITNINFDVIEEVEMITGASPAEAAVAEGAYINIVTKSGGNRFSGDIAYYFSTEDLNRSVLPEQQLNAMGLEKPILDKYLRDFSVSLGGPILKDRIWFFVNGRYIDTSRDTDNPDYGFDHTESLAFGKVTYQITSNFKFSGMFNFVDVYEPIIEGSYLFPKEHTRLRDHERAYTSSGTLSWLINQNTHGDLRLSYVNKNIPLRLQSEVQSSPTYLDSYTGQRWGASTAMGGNEDMKRERIQVTASLTRFQDNFLGGSHKFKVGLEFEKGYSIWDSWRENHRINYFFDGNPYLLGPGLGIYAYMITGYEPGEFSLKNNVVRFSGYIQDSFTIKDRLTFNLGIRYDESHGNQPLAYKNPSKDPVMVSIDPVTYGKKMEYPEYTDVFLWRNLSPRLGVSFDVFGNKKTVAMASFARYAESLMVDWFNRFGQIVPWYNMYLWFDLNLNKEHDLQGVDLYVPYSVQDISADPDRIDKLREKGAKAPFTHEFSIGISHEMFRNFSIGLSYIYKEKKNLLQTIDYNIGYPFNMDYFVPYSFTDPGVDGLFDTNDDKVQHMYAYKLDMPPLMMKVADIPELRRKYRGLEFTFNKRMSNGWQLTGSVVWSKTWGNVEGDMKSSAGFARFTDPNFFINRSGRLGYDRPLVIKLQTSVFLPWGFLLSGYFRHFDGTPLGRTLNVYLPPEIDGIKVQPIGFIYADPKGSSGRTAKSDILDIRVEKKFNLWRYANLRVLVDILNLLGFYNLNMNQDAGGIIFQDGTFQRNSQYGKISSVSGQRGVRITIKFSF